MNNDLIKRSDVEQMLAALGGCDASDKEAAGWDKAIDAALHGLGKVESADRWIPCSEKLPEKYGDYLIAWCHKEKYIKALQNEHYYEICEYSPEEGWLSNFPQCPEGYEVVAWKPLPEPYKEDLDDR